MIFYGVDPVDVSRRAAIYVNRILNGEKAGVFQLKHRPSSRWSKH